MEPYRNLAGASGISAYALEEDAITVHFTDGSRYRYDDHWTGSPYVEHMKALAIAGQGLHRFIRRSVGTLYAVKLSSPGPVCEGGAWQPRVERQARRRRWRPVAVFTPMLALARALRHKAGCPTISPRLSNGSVIPVLLELSSGWGFLHKSESMEMLGINRVAGIFM
jgi:hypothetical protein